MASIRSRSGAWRAEVYVNGVRESVTRPTKREATAWAQSREAELTGAKLPDHTVRDALRRYAREVCPTHKGRQWEEVRLKAMERDPIAGARLPALKASDVADWKQRRLAKVSPASVARELNLLRSVLEEAKREWVWLYGNPAKDVKRPATPASRKRRISADEIDRVTLACGLDGLEGRTASQRVGLAFLFALETAMRAGEILGLRWIDIRGKAAQLPQTKNGDQREVPLSARAREILGVLDRSTATVFNLDVRSRDVLWRRARDAAEVGDLHFHDSRAEAIWRLSKKLDVMELARVIGHRDLRSLMIYYQTSADELADRL